MSETTRRDCASGAGRGDAYPRPGMVVAAAALAIGIAAAAHYYVDGLTLSHYDAKAHLVVARRILDSLSPGWVQIGAVWLPLPHLLNLLPVQIDVFYRTGLSAVAISVTAFVIAATSLWRLVAKITGSAIAAWAAFAVLAAQPDVLYLQSTPMTEPLLMGLSLLAIAHIYDWVDADGVGSSWPGGVPLALACLTRYEAWPIAATVVPLTAILLWQRGVPRRVAAWRVCGLAIYPLAAIGAFLLLSRATVGSWLVSDGFFEITPRTFHHPLVALSLVGWGFNALNGTVMVTAGLLAAIIVAVAITRQRQSMSLLVVLALAAAAALPAYAFWKGHPFRIRYMVPLTIPLAAVIGIAVGSLQKYRWLAAAAVIVTALVEIPPFSTTAPMLLEAQWDRPYSVARERVAACLVAGYDQTLILASMGSLAHFMQELSRDGFYVRNFIHEGNGRMWAESLADPQSHAGWILIDERAEGGDVLAHRRAAVPSFLTGFDRLCDAGGVALYRRSHLRVAALSP